MDFRVALVVITTLVVTERPLSAGAKDLVWAPWLPRSGNTKGAKNGQGFYGDGVCMGYRVRNPYIYIYIYMIYDYIYICKYGNSR